MICRLLHPLLSLVDSGVTGVFYFNVCTPLHSSPMTHPHHPPKSLEDTCLKMAHLISYMISQHLQPQLPCPPTGSHSQVPTLNLNEPKISVSLNFVL